MIRQWMWRDFANILLGVWLLASPSTLGYGGTAMAWNDIAVGAFIAGVGVLTLFPRFDLARWALCFAGIWLLLAPLVFWTRDAGAYTNATLVGALVIAFSVLIPMMPSRAHHEVMAGPGPDTPPGWSYNPSAWIQRGPIIAMAFVGFFLSRYLAAYQLGHIDEPWDPFFGDGTRRVLDSEISKAWPVSDAGLGAVSYMLEALSGFMGGRNRWRTMPWMVLMFGFLVVPLGIVSIVLVMLQPIAVGAWCALCLVTAAAMLVMISPAIDEVVAMSQFLIGARRERKPFWRMFWVGGTLDAYAEKEDTARPREGDEPERGEGAPARRGARRGAGVPAAKNAERERPVASQILSAMELTAVPWTLIVSTAIGVWLMAAPAVFGTTGHAAAADHLIGALIVTWSVIAFGEIVRPIRLLNIGMAVALLISAWLLDGGSVVSRWNDVAAGAAVILLSLPRGRIVQRFGAWNRYLRW